MGHISLFKHFVRKNPDPPVKAFRAEPAHESVTYVGEVEFPENGSVRCYGNSLSSLAKRVALNIHDKDGTYELFSDPSKVSGHPAVEAVTRGLDRDEVMSFEKKLLEELGRLRGWSKSTR